jgi:hypothetical protein
MPENFAHRIAVVNNRFDTREPSDQSCGHETSPLPKLGSEVCIALQIRRTKVVSHLLYHTGNCILWQVDSLQRGNSGG